MPSPVLILCAAILTCALNQCVGADICWAGAPGQSNMMPPKGNVAMHSGRIIVKFKAGFTPAPGDGINVGPGIVVRGVEAATGLSTEAQSALDKIGARIEVKYTEMGLYRVTIGENMRVGRAIESLYRSGTVKFAEPDFKIQLEAVPNDPEFFNLWGLQNRGDVIGIADADIDAVEAWNSITSAEGVLVGVIDTGVDYTHEDLADNMWRNVKETNCSDGIDNDGNGYVDDCYGINSITGSGNPMDDQYHGTHCAGTIGARGNNGKGVVGVTWVTKIMALKFLDSSGSGWTSDAIECINYAIAVKKRDAIGKLILSNSWGCTGGGCYSQALYDAIKMAQANNVLFIAAAGNSSVETDVIPNYPSSFNLSNIISVGASDPYDKKAFFSNQGAQSVDIFAPGENIYSCKPGNSYQYLSGTSMATPHVAGACALVWARFPGQSALGVKGIVLNGSEDGRATPKPFFRGKCVSEGRLNLLNSIKSPVIQNDPAIFSVTPNRADIGQKVEIEGVGFGNTPGSLILEGMVFPATSIVSWTKRKIVAEIPTDIPLAGDG